MRRTAVYDPRFIRSMQPAAIGLASLIRCAVFRTIGDRPGWVAGSGNTPDTVTKLWEGFCRVQPMIDMRARAGDFAGEYDAVEAVRFNLPFERNEFGATLDINNKIVTYGDDPVFAYGDMIDVTQVFNPGQQVLLPKRFTVRNALSSTTALQHDLLCDVGASLHG